LYITTKLEVSPTTSCNQVQYWSIGCSDICCYRVLGWLVSKPIQHYNLMNKRRAEMNHILLEGWHWVRYASAIRSRIGLTAMEESAIGLCDLVDTFKDSYKGHHFHGF